MSVFDPNGHYNRHYNRLIVAPIHIKHVHSSVSYQWMIYKRYDRSGHESPSGYGPLLSHHRSKYYNISVITLMKIWFKCTVCINV